MATTRSGRGDSIIYTLTELEDSQSGLFHSEGHAEESLAIAIQTHCVALGQGSAIGRVDRTYFIDNSIEPPEAMLFNPDDLNRAESDLYGSNAFSLSRSQGICSDFADTPKRNTEVDGVTQQCGGQPLVAQFRLQYGQEAVNHLQTTQIYGSNSDANRQQFPTVSTTTYCEDRGKSWRKERVHKATTSKSVRQQRVSPSQFVQQPVSPTSTTGE
jgi:hypothetical protein